MAAFIAGGLSVATGGIALLAALGIFIIGSLIYMIIWGIGIRFRKRWLMRPNFIIPAKSVGD